MTRDLGESHLRAIWLGPCHLSCPLQPPYFRTGLLFPLSHTQTILEAPTLLAWWVSSDPTGMGRSNQGFLT